MKKFEEFEDFDSEDTNNVFDDNELNEYVFENGEFVNKNSELEKDNHKEEKGGTKMEPIKEKKVTKKYKLSKDVLRIIGLTISGILVVLSLLTLAKSFVPAQKIDNLILSYNVSNDVDYRVNLLENNFYETTSLGKGELVPVTFIDDVEIDFSGYLSASKVMDMNYTYEVTGEIIATATDNGKDGGGKIWTKNYVFVPKTAASTSGTGYNLQEKVIIDYQMYNDLVNQYKLQASVTMDVVMNVTMTVTANSMVEGKELSERNSVTVKIPLSVSTVMINSDAKDPVAKTLIDSQEIPASNNYVLLAISLVILIGSVITSALLLKGLRKMTEDHSLLLKFNRIMRDYNQVIIEIDELPMVKDAAIIEVKSFQDMLDIEKELHLPIMCARSKTDVLTDNIFYIVNQNQVFKYRLNAEPERF